MSVTTSLDVRQADAFRDLEGLINKVRDASAVLDMAANDTVYLAEIEHAKDLRRRCGIKGYHLLMMTDDQGRALNYAIGHLCELVCEVYRRYHGDEA